MHTWRVTKNSNKHKQSSKIYLHCRVRSNIVLMGGGEGGVGVGGVFEGVRSSPLLASKGSLYIRAPSFETGTLVVSLLLRITARTSLVAAMRVEDQRRARAYALRRKDARKCIRKEIAIPGVQELTSCLSSLLVMSMARRLYQKHSLTSPGPVSLYNTGSHKHSLVPPVSVSFCRRVLPASLYHPVP